MPTSRTTKSQNQAHTESVTPSTGNCHNPVWERPPIPEGWTFSEDAFKHISPGVACMTTTDGDVWTTYLAFASIQEAYQAYQFIKQKGLATYAEIRSPAKWMTSKAELKIWQLNDEWFNRLADASAGSTPTKGG